MDLTNRLYIGKPAAAAVKENKAKEAKGHITAKKKKNHNCKIL